MEPPFILYIPHPSSLLVHTAFILRSSRLTLCPVIYHRMTPLSTEKTFAGRQKEKPRSVAAGLDFKIILCAA